MLEIFALAGSLGFGDPGGVSMRRSKGCSKISLEKISGDGLFRR